MSDNSNNVSSKDFWSKIRKTLGKIPFARNVIAMWHCMRDPATPLWVKIQIGGALAYFISPIDAIPDAIPVLGYTDDAAVIAATFGIVQAFVTDDHFRKADDFLGRD
jgi:uncharacterized membrane protein YkvA (DUF1232 family)